MSTIFSDITCVFLGIFAIIILLCLLIYLIVKLMPKKMRKASALRLEQKLEEGYIGVDMSPGSLVGHTGKAVTPLRPAGKVKIDGKLLDATTLGDFINAGSQVIITKYEAAQIYVEPLTD